MTARKTWFARFVVIYLRSIVVIFPCFCVFVFIAIPLFFWTGHSWHVLYRCAYHARTFSLQRIFCASRFLYAHRGGGLYISNSSIIHYSPLVWPSVPPYFLGRLSTCASSLPYLRRACLCRAYHTPSPHFAYSPRFSFCASAQCSVRRAAFALALLPTRFLLAIFLFYLLRNAILTRLTHFGQLSHLTSPLPLTHSPAPHRALLLTAHCSTPYISPLQPALLRRLWFGILLCGVRHAVSCASASRSSSRAPPLSPLFALFCAAIGGVWRGGASCGNALTGLRTR